MDIVFFVCYNFKLQQDERCIYNEYMQRLKTLKAFFITSALGFLLISLTIPGWSLWIYFLVFAVLLLIDKRHPLSSRIHLSPKQSIILFIILSWATGMILEAFLPGVGGMHKKTIPSFILAQGYYIPFAIIMLWLIRKHHYTYWEAFFAAGLASIWESVFILRGVTLFLFSPFFLLTPLVFMMYVTTYGALVGIPLLFIDEKLLWGKEVNEITQKQKMIKGIFIAGLGGIVVYILWMFIMNILFHNFDSFSDILGPTHATNLQ